LTALAPADLVFEGARPRLRGLAYRMLGSVADAEDVVQDAWLRWRGADASSVRDPDGFLVRVVTRLCLDRMKSARSRRETYVGTWLPEPWVEPDDAMETADSAAVAFLLALERLTPAERAAFLLHDIFDQPFEQVAAALDRTPEACRQLAARARRHVREAKPRARPDRAAAEALVDAFFQAARTGDLASITALLAEDAVLVTDGGGRRVAALNPVYGRERILRLAEGLARKFPLEADAAWTRMPVNGQPGFLITERAGLTTYALDVDQGVITAIYVVRNPEKLRHLSG
jgi:RNA polymerase sigma-70 factor (ECF subfamily)